MTSRFLQKTLIVAAVSAALSGAYSITVQQGPWDVYAATPVTALPDMSEIVARNGPAVVNISVAGTVRAQTPDFPGLDPNDPFFEFFRRFRIPQQRGERQVRGQGSGFIVRDDGLILTNAHVINEADEVVVRLNDKREFKAKVLGADKVSDVAVLKIEARGLPTVKIGDSSNTRVGEWVLAIGSPYGFESSATAGIVSAKSRSLPDDNYVPFIQTDVAVNPGNSGGPLFNMAGEVIGINSQIYSRTGGYQGLSFAIPIDVAVSVQDQILKYGKVQRGRLGVSIQEVNQSLAESFGLSKPAGALISSVEKGSPAAGAGLEPGDVILSVNGREVESSSELPPIIAGIRPGDSAKLQIWRKGRMRDIEVKVGGVESEDAASNGDKDAGPGKLGLSLRPLRPEESRRYGQDGLVVESASGAAARAGIRAGDVVLSVNGEAVSSVEQLRALV
ncbi:MAG: Do family serine endopeptidase, partial [Candidatus Accumulibacter sp.]|nr:Do family serine endopeptidase [Accumulibacter sp.]